MPQTKVSGRAAPQLEATSTRRQILKIGTTVGLASFASVGCDATTEMTEGDRPTAQVGQAILDREPDAVLHSPGTLEIQRMLDRLGRMADPQNPRLLTIRGRAEATRVALRSHVSLHFDGARVTTAMRPRAVEADNPGNALFVAERTLLPDVLDATLVADAIPGDLSLAVSSTGKITPGAWLWVSGVNDYDRGGSDGYYESGPREPVAELLQVRAVEDGRLELRSPVKVWHTGAGTSPHAVIACIPVEGIDIVGGEFDCSGLAVACGFSFRGARDVRMVQQAAKGFSRAFVQAGEGCWQFEMSGYRRRGGSNADLLAISSHVLACRDWDFDPDGDYTHPFGYVRASLAVRTRCTSVDIENSRFGRSAVGIECFGGHDVRISSVRFSDLDGTKRVDRGEPGQDLGHRCGVALNMGATSIEALSEFAQGFLVDGVFCENIKTYDRDARQYVMYLHDAFMNQFSNIFIRHYGRHDQAPNGILLSDAHYFGAGMSDVRIVACKRPLVVENRGSCDVFRNVSFTPTTYSSVDPRNIEEYAVYWGGEFSEVLWDGCSVGNVYWFSLKDIPDDGTRDRYSLNHLFVNQLVEGIGRVGRMRVVRLNEVAFEQGKIVKLAPSADAHVRAVAEVDEGAQDGCWVLAEQVGGGTHALAIPAGSYGSVLVLAEETVRIGDRLVHRKGGRAGVAKTTDSPGRDIGRAIASRPAGRASLVRYET